MIKKISQEQSPPQLTEAASHTETHQKAEAPAAIETERHESASPAAEKRPGRFGGFLKFRRTNRERPALEEANRIELPDAQIVGDDNRANIGWVSPTYTLSRSVTLDPQLLARNRCIVDSVLHPMEADAYRILRAQLLQRCKEKKANTLMVTSAMPGEGKTLTAINLAITIAKEFTNTVLLVDCDLRQQAIHNYFGYKSEKGLIDYILYDTPVPELMVWPGIEKLTVISGGRPNMGSSELLGSPRMREFVADMKSRYPDRYIIFDVPSFLTSADPMAFVPMVDQIVFAVRAGRTSVQDVRKALKMVPAEKVLGLVLNGSSEGRLPQERHLVQTEYALPA
jgi:protein-tyrosine kinase